MARQRGGLALGRSRARTTAVLATVLVMSLVVELRAAEPASAAAGNISTWAGGKGQGPARNVAMRPSALALNGSSLYVSDADFGMVRALDTQSARLRVVAGNGDNSIFSVPLQPEPVPATGARLGMPRGLAFDQSGNLSVTDFQAEMVKRVSPSGLMTTFPARLDASGASALWRPSGAAYDTAGNLYVSEAATSTVKRVDPLGRISTFAGGCHSCPEVGDGRPATEVLLAGPRGLATDIGGNVYIAERGTNRIRKVNAAGVITTVAGGGMALPGDGRPATEAALNGPQGVTLDSAGNLYISEREGNRVRKVDTSGTITTVAGGGSGALVDGGPATSATLSAPDGVAVADDGTIYVADTDNYVVRKIDRDRIITTVAGNGTPAYGGDGGSAVDAQFANSTGLAYGPDGSMYVADAGDHRVRRIDPAGRISTVAGTGERGFSGDGGPATAAMLGVPRSVAVDDAGNVYIADTGNHRVRRVDPSGTIETVTGGGTEPLGDGGPAEDVALEDPLTVAVDADGNLYVTDSRNNRVRKIDHNGTISTVAGGGTSGIQEGSLATQAQLALRGNPSLAFDPAGQLHIGMYTQIAKVDHAGRIWIVAGGGQTRYGPWVCCTKQARDFLFNDLGGVTFDADGAMYFIDSGLSGVVLTIDPGGQVREVGGTMGSSDALNDGGLATKARIDATRDSGLLIDPAGNLFVSDANRIRRIENVRAIKPQPPQPRSVLVSANSAKVMHAPATAGGQITQRAWTGANSQRWRMVPLAGDIYAVFSGGTNMVLQVGATSNGAPVVQSPWNGGVGQWWRVLPFGPPTSGGAQAYLLVSVLSGKVVDVAGAAKTEGAPVVQWTWNGGANQIWVELKV